MTTLSELGQAKMSNIFDEDDSTFYNMVQNKFTKPWIQLELKDVGVVKQVKLLRRIEFSGEKVARVEVRIGSNEINTDNDDAIPKNKLCGKLKMAQITDKTIESGETSVEDDGTDKETQENENPAKDDEKDFEVVIIMCPTPLIGKYVTIQMRDENVKKYGIAEVELYGPMNGRSDTS